MAILGDLAMPLINVPLTGQSLDVTRNPINTNFSTINTAFAVNHVQYTDGSGNQGFHNFIQLPTGTPTKDTLNPPINGTLVALYSKNGATSGVPELYFQRNNLAANMGYAITEGINLQLGFTRWPCGTLVKWGTAAVTGTTTVVTYNGGLSGPAITTPFHIQLTPFNPGGSRISDFDKVPWFAGFTGAGQFTMKCNNTSQPISVYYYILGL